MCGPRTSVELIDSIVDCEHRTRRSVILILALAGSATAVLAAIAAGMDAGDLGTALLCSGAVSVAAVLVDRNASSWRRAHGHRVGRR